MLVIDYFSKFIFVEKVSTTTAKSTINKFSNIFATEGAPQQLMTDNGPPFNSSEFSRFCQEWNLEHCTSSPNYPQSDGQAERAVQTVKQRMARCKQDGQDFKQALLQMRTTPMSKDLPSPFENQLEQLMDKQDKEKSIYEAEAHTKAGKDSRTL